MTALSPLASWLLIGWLAIAAIYLALFIAGTTKHTPRPNGTDRRGRRTVSSQGSELANSRAHPERRATPRYVGGRRKADWTGSR